MDFASLSGHINMLVSEFLEDGGDPNMCEAFRLGKDIHTATAAKVYGIEEAEGGQVEDAVLAYGGDKGNRSWRDGGGEQFVDLSNV